MTPILLLHDKASLDKLKAHMGKMRYNGCDQAKGPDVTVAAQGHYKNGKLRYTSIDIVKIKK